MPFNAELADQVLAQIKANPNSWNQKEWGVKPTEDDEDESGEACQTAFCFAGWACFLSGVGFKYQQTEINGTVCLVATQTDTAEDIQTKAEELLGIPEGEGLFSEDPLFEGGNTLADIERIVSGYKSGELFTEADEDDE